MQSGEFGLQVRLPQSTSTRNAQSEPSQSRSTSPLGPTK
jgi:hypothetical protein